MPTAHAALLEWRNANGVVVAHDDEATALATGGRFTQFMLDVQCAPAEEGLRP
jgi:hypothetical protein